MVLELCGNIVNTQNKIKIKLMRHTSDKSAKTKTNKNNV